MVLGFVEPKATTKVAERVFDVEANGTKVITGLDVLREAGAYRTVLTRTAAGRSFGGSVGAFIHADDRGGAGLDHHHHEGVTGTERRAGLASGLARASRMPIATNSPARIAWGGGGQPGT